MSIKGKYRGQSGLSSVFPLNFDYTPGRIGRRQLKPIRPKPLRDLIALKKRLAS